MSRRLLLPVALGALLLGGVPALAADANGSSETKTVERSCGADMTDNHYSQPGPGDCRDADGSYDARGTYQATHWTNDVECGDSGPTPANPTGIRVYGAADQASQSGRLGVCSDGSGDAPAPVQGRAGVDGGTAEGYRVVVDGDKDNPNETSQGYVVVTGGAGAPTVRCGDEYAHGGRADSDSPQDRDTQDECGG